MRDQRNRLIRVRLPFAFALIALGACKTAPKANLGDTPGALQAGAGRATIQEPIGAPTAGYAQSPYLGSPLPADEPGSPYVDMFPSTRGMQSAPTAKAIVLDNGVSHVVIAKIDAVGMTDILTERVIQLAKQNIPGPGGDIEGKLIISGTHSHDAMCRYCRTSVEVNLFTPNDFPPGDPRSNALAHGFDTYSQEMTDRVANAVVDAISAAQSNLAPAVFGYAEGENETAAHDRRCENNHLPGYGNGYHDPRVRVLRFDNAATGDPIAVVINYAMHGTIYDTGNHNLSVDAPGTAEYFTEQQFEKPVVAMYMQGNAADVGPSYGNNNGSQAMEFAGWQLANTVFQLWQSITPAEKVIPLQVKERWTAITYNLLGYPPVPKEGPNVPPPVGAAYFYPDGAGLCFQVFGNYQCPPGGTHTTADIVDPNQLICLTQVNQGYGKYSTRFAAARIGDIGIMAIPGEPSTKVGELLEDGLLSEFPDLKHALVFGYAQDHNGYILMDEDWLSGGYNPTITFWGWRFGAYTVEQGKDVFQEMATGTASFPNYASPSQIPDMTPDTTTPNIVPTDSMTPPGISIDVPATSERLTALNFSWYGGDPGLNHPVVTIQMQQPDGTFMDLTHPTPMCGSANASCWTSGWIPINDLTGFDFTLFYSATPTFKANPTATARDHSWEAVYEPPIDLPVGTYRFHITGNANSGGKTVPYDFTTGNVAIGVSTQLTVDSKIQFENGVLVFDGTLTYPQQDAVWDPINTDWQKANFRSFVPRWGSQFAPAEPQLTQPTGTFTPGSAVGQNVTFTYVVRPVSPETVDYKGAPDTGPSLHAEVPVAQSTAYSLQLPVFTDVYGNTSASTTLTGTGP